MKRAKWALLVAVASCAPSAPLTSPSSALPAPLLDASTVPPADGGASVDAAASETATKAPLPPLDFGTRPNLRDPSPFYVVVDGHCAGLRVSLLPDATLISYGEDKATVARATERGLTETDTLSRGLDKLSTPGPIYGRYETKMWMTPTAGFRCTSHDVEFTGTKDGWTPGSGYSTGDGDPGVVSHFTHNDHGALFELEPGTGCGSDADPTKRSIIAEGIAPANLAKLAADRAAVVTMKLLSGGEIVAAMMTGVSEWELRVALPEANKSVIRRRLPSGEISIVGDAIDDLFVTAAQKNHDKPIPTLLLHWDSAASKWTELPPPPGMTDFTAMRAPHGELWLQDSGRLSKRSKEGTYTEIATPQPVHDVVGVDKGAPWALFPDDSLVKYENGAWTNVPLPRPPFAEDAWYKVEHIDVRDASDVWINATYTEKPTGWGKAVYERHRALLRTVAPDETVRCAESDDTPQTGYSVGESGFQSWPPSATESCTTPLVVLASMSAKKPAAQSDYKRSRSFFAKRAEFAGATFFEVASGVRKYLVAKVPTMSIGHEMVAYYAKKASQSRPRLVCANPTPIRSFEVDLGSQAAH